MADEIRDQNVVRITFEADVWHALLGPDAQSGLTGHGASPAAALFDLACRVSYYGYACDPTWQPPTSRRGGRLHRSRNQYQSRFEPMPDVPVSEFPVVAFRVTLATAAPLDPAAVDAVLAALEADRFEAKLREEAVFLLTASPLFDGLDVLVEPIA